MTYGETAPGDASVALLLRRAKAALWVETNKVSVLYSPPIDRWAVMLPRRGWSASGDTWLETIEYLMRIDSGEERSHAGL